MSGSRTSGSWNDFHVVRSFYRDTLGLHVGFDDGENFADRRLSSGAVRFVAPPKDMVEWGIRIALFRYPDGNLVEIIQPLARG